MFERIKGVFKLDVKTFEEIEHDSNATSQAAIIVAIVAFLSAIGSGLAAQYSQSSFLGSFITTLIWTFVGWFLWAVVSWFVGTKFFGGQTTIDEMLRVIGGIWSLIAGFIGIRQGLDLDNTKAFLTILVGFLFFVAGSLIIQMVMGGLGSLLN